MSHIRTAGKLLTALLLLVTTPILSVYGANKNTFYVATNGADSNTCGPTDQRPCRSITQAIANAGPGDDIIVGPGRYGDLDQNGVLSEPGEEAPAAGCGCMLAVNKAVSIYSSDGAAVTVIDARTLNVMTNVLIITNGGEFGRPGQGFTVTSTGAGQFNSTLNLSDAKGIAVDSNGVSIRGNRITPFLGFVVALQSELCVELPGFGIYIVDSPGVILIEGNQVSGWLIGVVSSGTNKTINQNALYLNAYGLFASGTASITGNVVMGSGSGCGDIDAGIDVVGNRPVAGNSFIGE